MSDADDRARTFGLFAEHVNKGKAETFREFGLDVVMGERGGIRFHDLYSDRSFINCHCNGGVFNLGHRNPAVLAAVQDALGRVDIGNHHLVSNHRAELARRLSATTGDALPGVVFAVAGGEAIDLAIKVARAGTGRVGIVSALGGYHGHTGLALAAGDAQYRDPFGDNLPGFRQVPFDDIAALEAAVGDDTAAVMLEPIPATLGMPIPGEDYLARVSALCRERGAKLIIDEVQTGLGRTGTMWCYQGYGIEPDVVVTGKGLSGGIYPIAATLMTRELHSLFDTDPFVHISTYGGAEPGCVAGLAVLDQTEAEGFLDHVVARGAQLGEGLTGLPFEVRRRGMFMGLKFVAERAGMFAAKVLYDRGVFAVWANNDRSVLQFLVPLTITENETEELIGIVRGCFS